MSRSYRNEGKEDREKEEVDHDLPSASVENQRDFVKIESTKSGEDSSLQATATSLIASMENRAICLVDVHAVSVRKLAPMSRIRSGDYEETALVRK